VHAVQGRPELEEAQRQIAALQDQLEAGHGEMSRLRADLAEAQKLKSEEEKQLVEFKLLRAKENELQSSKMEVQQLQAELEEFRASSRQLETRCTQHQSTIKEKSEKIIALVKQLDHEVEQVRLLSDENNTLRLELGRDAEYLKVVAASADPLSYKSAAGALAEDLLNEEQQFREDLRSLAAKYPGLPKAGDHYNHWCELQISRVSDLHRSFLHRLQDHRSDFPEDVKVEFSTPTEEAQKGWMQQEAVMTKAGVEFQEAEQEHNRRWEEHRLKLTFERDSKVKQLLDQAERSQSKAEKQLLMQQAKLYGQRIDAQLDRAWEDQRQERETRWSLHQQQKQELRQKIKEESLAMAQRAEDQASASSRFTEAASNKLAAVEDAWLRNAERAGSVSAQAMKSRDFESCLRALQTSITAAADSVGCTGCVSSSTSQLPARGSQYTGVGLMIDQVESLLTNRMEMRTKLRKELEDQSRQQLRSCVEKFVQREGVERDNEELPESHQAASIVGLLRMRQHRHVSDAMRRQFQDYLLVLRLCSLGALWLSPSGSSQDGVEDLPPLPAELCFHKPRDALCVGSSPPRSGSGPQADVDDAAFEGNFLYRTLCQNLLERALKLLSEMQRDELLALKRAYAAEQRLALQHLCQLETEMVEKAVQQDLQEYEVQLASRLLSDSERQISEEHQRQASRVNQDVAVELAKYKLQVAEEDQAIVQDRQKWVMNRIVCLQANGTVNPNDRALLLRLRAELQACDTKIDEFNANAMAQADLEREAVRPRPPSTGQRRRSSDELTAAEVSDRQAVATQGIPDEPLPLGLAALGGLRSNRAAMTFGRCESPDFGVKADPTDWPFTTRHGMHGNLGRLKPKGNYGAQDLPPKQQAGASSILGLSELAKCPARPWR
ncbi:unnamed protein product, partial [Symbiodinium necroappetens]